MSTTSPQEGVPERIDPEREPIGVVSYHLAKYAFARRLIGTSTVLDVASGVGYGTYYLADLARRAIGIELAPEAIEVARQRYSSDRCHFVQANAEQLPIAPGSFDSVVCFEGIEHFRDPDAHLREVGRVLRPDGVYIVSTPHPDAHTHGADNPFHLHAFDVDEFRSMLGARFRSIELLGQRRRQSDAHVAAQRADVLGLRRVRWLRPVARRVSRTVLGTRGTEDATIDDFLIEPWTPGATEYIAVCRDPMT